MWSNNITKENLFQSVHSSTGTEWGLKTFCNPSKQTCAALWGSVLRLKACGPSDVNSPSHLQSLWTWKTGLSVSATVTFLRRPRRAAHPRIHPFKHAKTLPKAIFCRHASLAPLLSLHLHSSPASSSHMSLITMCVNVYPTTKESALGPRECAEFLPMHGSSSARLWCPACYNGHPPTAREGSGGFGPRAESAVWTQWSILEQRLGSLHSPLCSYSYFTNEGQSPTRV